MWSLLYVAQRQEQVQQQQQWVQQGTAPSSTLISVAVSVAKM